METLWFIIVAVMLTVYVVLDGFDIGAGIIYLVAAKKDQERRAVLKAMLVASADLPMPGRPARISRSE